jgi:flagellar basal body-associated protein FliL
MDTDLGRSRKILTSMARRAWANKFIMVFIIIALVMFIALIVYIQWFSSPAKTKANARRLLVQLRT